LRFRKAPPEFHFLLALLLGVLILATRVQREFLAEISLNLVSIPLRAVSWVSHSYTDFRNEYLRDRERQQIIEELQKEKIDLQNQVNLLTLQLLTVRSEQELVTFQGKDREGILVRVITNGPMITINRGSTSGIRRNSVVVSGQGLVGMVVRPGLMVSQVLPITNPLASVSVVDSRNGEHGIVRGLGNGYLQLQYLPATSSVLTEDLLISDGRDGIFPEGMIVGRVLSVQRDEFSLTAVLEPSVVYPLLDVMFVFSSEGEGQT